jgi:hypothetical protein
MVRAAGHGRASRGGVGRAMQPQKKPDHLDPERERNMVMRRLLIAAVFLMVPLCLFA